MEAVVFVFFVQPFSRIREKTAPTAIVLVLVIRFACIWQCSFQMNVTSFDSILSFPNQHHYFQIATFLIFQLMHVLEPIGQRYLYG